MRRILILLALCAVAACSAALAWPKGGGAQGFRLADASAACRVDAGALVCRSRGVRSGLSLPAKGSPRAVAAPIWWDSSTPVLHHWKQNGLDCRASGGTIVCHNASGATISVSSSRIAVAL